MASLRAHVFKTDSESKLRWDEQRGVNVRLEGRIDGLDADVKHNSDAIWKLKASLAVLAALGAMAGTLLLPVLTWLMNLVKALVLPG